MLIKADQQMVILESFSSARIPLVSRECHGPGGGRSTAHAQEKERAELMNLIREEG